MEKTLIFGHKKPDTDSVTASIALSYLKNNGYNESTPCRFDVIGIYADKTINHAENAFEFTSYF